MNTKLIIVLILLITIYLLYYFKHNTNWIILLSILNIFIILEILKDKDFFVEKFSPLLLNHFIEEEREINDMLINDVLNNDDNLNYSFIDDSLGYLKEIAIEQAAKSSNTISNSQCSIENEELEIDDMLINDIINNDHKLDYSFINHTRQTMYKNPKKPKKQNKLLNEERNLFDKLHKLEDGLERCVKKHCNTQVHQLFSRYNSLYKEYEPNLHRHINMDNFSVEDFKKHIQSHVNKLNANMDKYDLEQFTRCICNNKNCLTLIKLIKYELQKIEKFLKKNASHKELKTYAKKHMKYHTFMLYTVHLCEALEKEEKKDYRELIKILNNQTNRVDKEDNDLKSTLYKYKNKNIQRYTKEEAENDIIKINIIKIIEEK